MSVAQLLSRKPPDVVSVQAGTTVMDAIKLLADKKIGAVVVTDESGGVAGILSERDIVRGMAARGASVMTQVAADLMTAPVQTCTRSDVADDVMRRMSSGRFRHMPVVEGDRLVGIVSIGDVVQYRIASLEQEAGAMREYIMTG